MPTLRLATAIENVQGDDEENVLALLDHLVPTLTDWRQGEHFRAEQARLSPKVEPLKSKVQQLLDRINGLRTGVDRLTADAKKRQNLSNIIFVGAVLVAAILWFVLGLIVAGAALVVGAGLGVWTRRRRSSRRRSPNGLACNQSSRKSRDD
jgi:Flp pilus assembly protein TadB